MELDMEATKYRAWKTMFLASITFGVWLIVFIAEMAFAAWVGTNNVFIIVMVVITLFFTLFFCGLMCKSLADVCDLESDRRKSKEKVVSKP